MNEKDRELECQKHRKKVRKGEREREKNSNY